MEMKHLYRVEHQHDEGCTHIIFKEYQVHKTTPKGFYILDGQRRRFVLDNKCWKGKRFAYETKDEALEAFIKRKERQIVITKRILANSTDLIRLAQNIIADKDYRRRSTYELREDNYYQ